MGAVSWPALGESTKSAPKVSPSDSIKTGERSSSSSVAVAAPPPPAPVVANHQMKAISNNANPTYPNSSRQKPMRRVSGCGASSNNHGLHLQPNGEPIFPQFPPAPADMSHEIMSDKPAGQGQEPLPRDMHNNRNNNWDHGSSSRGGGLSPHSHGGLDHHRPLTRRNSNNGGGSGGPHNGGGRRDSDRGGYSTHTNDWNNNPSPRHMPPQQPRGHHPRPFVRPPPPPPPAAAPPFVAPPPVRSFVGPPMGFPAEIPPPPVFYVHGPPPPFVAAHPVAHAMPPPILVPELHRNLVLKQIEYYFSNGNLCKDMYLRRHMDEQGWVPVALIAGFNRVRQLTNNIPNNINYILDLVRSSELVEVQGENIRRRGDWMIWVLPSQPSPHGSTSSPHSPAAPNVDSMVDHMQSMVLEERNSNHSSGGATVTEVFGRTASGNFINPSQVGNSNDNRYGRPAGNAASDQ